MARDAQILEQHLSPTRNRNTTSLYARSTPYSVYSDDPRNPVVYMKVPRQRGIPPAGNGTSSFSQFETMQKILEPLGPELFHIYFDNIHPAFPILDEKTVREAYSKDGLPYTLICEIYAVSLLLWNTSPIISETRRPSPDIKYMWNLAVNAMNEDFLAPNFSTILACILDLLGRPITSITYNAVNIGRVVSLSLSLGLNRDPANWNLDHRQKSLRVRTWWGVLIHDTWASLSHGTPPHIHSSQWDVLLPDIDSLLMGTVSTADSFPDAWMQGAKSFIALCGLTEILGDILALVYTLKPSREHNCLKSLRRLEAKMDEWEDNLDTWLRPGSLDFQKIAPGALNLQLSSLAVKMCISRIALQETVHRDDNDDWEARRYYLSQCRKTAQAIINFVLSLNRTEIDAFWLPYSAYHFASAVTLILRCALETEDDNTARECVTSAKDLLDFLRTAKHNWNWDLGDICINQSETIVEKLTDNDYLASRRRYRHASTSGLNNSTTDRAAFSIPAGADDAEVQSEDSQFRPLDSTMYMPESSEGTASVAFGNSTMCMDDLLNSSAIFGLGQNIAPEIQYFPDFWPMPYMDGYS
ncbi:transcriptional regulator family: Fungal Specific TF [Paecilomyces variotii]|nr:transcriptional regulator family: Fungal Specific TF [Paecilomyces variotii]KAJ9198162.1 transcriptional regulator family: Fungal Specific TF [Paecilomyces variotii]KAJ9275903.1 transcriptional regulator family: Fungal Specific TF [Paecilomyces variotii]KAJ9344612.1 transcriptional regulator family: Fungal Specific TF [Paecilomyces variotii]KAJ9362484.1 transcriptional regulator family: Fungal Specific TF [Paecilomyces variotii]